MLFELAITKSLEVGLKKVFNYLIFLIILSVATQSTFAQLNDSEKKLNFGLNIGMVKHDIHLTREYYYPDKISKNNNVCYGAFARYNRRWVYLETSVGYKKRSLRINNDPSDYYGYTLDLEMQYFEIIVKSGFVFDIPNAKMSFFAGIGNGYLIDAEDKYIADYTTFKIEENLQYNDSPWLKKYIRRNSLFYLLGLEIGPNLMEQRFHFGFAVDLIKPTNQYAEKYLEGAYDPLAQVFRLSSYQFYIKIDVFSPK